MTLVIDLPQRAGYLSCQLPSEPDTARRVIERLAPHIPREGIWRVQS